MFNLINNQIKMVEIYYLTHGPVNNGLAFGKNPNPKPMFKCSESSNKFKQRRVLKHTIAGFMVDGQ